MTTLPTTCCPTATASTCMLTDHNEYQRRPVHGYCLILRVIAPVSLFAILLSKPRLSDKSTAGAYTIPTSSQPSYGADSSSAWPPLSHRFRESFANLRPPTYTPQRSSPASQSQYSDSAWETLPPSPFADDNDSWLVPDENSASMQSYNDPRTGIWAPEDAYGPGTGYSSMRDMGHDNGGNFTMTQLLQPHLQQVIANADSATPFSAQPDSNGGGFLLNTGLGANESPHSAAPLSSPPSTSGGPVSQSFQSSIKGQSAISIVVDSAIDLGASSARQPQAVERLFFQLGSDQSSFSDIAPRIALGNPPLPATDLPSTRLIGSLAPAPSPSPSADTSNAEGVRCSHRGCRVKFGGEFWKDSLRRHKTHFHGDKKKPTCPVCNLVFKSGRPDNLIRHIMAQHPGYPLPASRNARPRKLARRQRRS